MKTQELELTAKTEVNLQKIENYLETTSEHLFLTENGRFFKAFPIKVKDSLYCVSLEFDGLESNYVRIIDVNYFVNNYGNDSKFVLSKTLFPQHLDKRSSIPNFKAMRELTEKIKKCIEETFDGTNRQVVEKEIAKMLVGMEVKKEEKKVE